MFGLARLLFNGRDVQDAVHVEPHAAEHLVGLSRGSQTFNREIAHQEILERIVVLALIDGNSHGGLIRMGGCVAFRASDRQRGVAINDGVIAMRIRKAPAFSQVRRAEGKG